MLARVVGVCHPKRIETQSEQTIMEFNVKNCLGPSDDPIEIAHGAQCHWFDENVQTVDTSMGYGGANWITVYNAPDEEVEWAERRLEQLEDLMRLKTPPSMEYCQGQMCSWTGAEIKAYEDHCAQDCCATDDDPMGDMMGRNL